MLRAFAFLLLLSSCQSLPQSVGVDLDQGVRTIESTDGGLLEYEVHGQGSPAVIFLHGWNGDRSYWRHQVAPLARETRVVVLDFPGHGASVKGEGDLSIESLARDVRRVVDELRLESVVLVGHSMGAPVALVAAEDLGGRCSAVIGVDALRDAEFKVTKSVSTQLVAAYASDFDGMVREFVRSYSSRDIDPGLRSWLEEDMASAPVQVALPLLRAVMDFDAKSAMQACSAPVRCINSPSPETQVEKNRAYADYDARVIEGAGHFLMLESPARFNLELREVLAEFGVGT